jgi:threonine dehydratase
MINIDLIHAARERISSRIHRTPVMTSRLFNAVAGKEVFFKCENLQRAGAFKIRGATNKIRSLTPDEKRRGIVAFSSGNHAQAVALAGREAGVRVVVAMPDDAPKMKVAATRDYGAEIIFYDRLKADREKFALDLAEREQLVMVPPYDDELILAGQATCGMEFLEDVKELDCLLTPCSGGGLFAGEVAVTSPVGIMTHAGGTATCGRNVITRQPRRAASASSCGSGSTATGSVTRSRSGMSLCESL